MNHGRRTATLLVFCSLLCLLAFVGCPSAPPVIIDTTGVDSVIVDVADTAGTIEMQTVTVYQTVEKLIYSASPEEKALVEKQFNDLRASITHLKTLGPELARVHAVEVGKMAQEIARLVPFEIEAEKQKAAKWRAYGIAGILAALIVIGVVLKLKGFP
jgi:hypothetical protein